MRKVEEANQHGFVWLRIHPILSILLSGQEKEDLVFRHSDFPAQPGEIRTAGTSFRVLVMLGVGCTALLGSRLLDDGVEHSTKPGEPRAPNS